MNFKIIHANAILINCFLFQFLGFLLRLCNGHPVSEVEKERRINSRNLFEDPEVFITLCAVAGMNPDDGSYQDTMIELNWARFQSPGLNDWIGLFDYNVESPPVNSITNHAESALVSIPINTTDNNQPSHYYKTNIRFGHPSLNSSSDSDSNDNCLGYWIAYMSGSGIDSAPILTNCFRKYPTWMNDLRPIIGNTPLHSLMIPGTHDAGAIRKYDGNASEVITVKYSVNQEEELYRQFIYGIRYMDVRVAYYENTVEKFWINHGSARFKPLVTLFNAVKQFVVETNEILFIDFHGFPVGMDSVDRHAELLEFVQEQIGDLLVHKSMVSSNWSDTSTLFNVTPNTLWGLNRAVILTYQREDINVQHDFLWPYLIHAWGDVNQVNPLESYFNDVAIPAYGCKGIFWSAMAEMTPTAADAILYPNRGLRGFAQMVNIPLTFWWERVGWYTKSMIVSTDFFLGNNIIEMSIKINRNGVICQDEDDEGSTTTTTTTSDTSETTTQSGSSLIFPTQILQMFLAILLSIAFIHAFN